MHVCISYKKGGKFIVTIIDEWFTVQGFIWRDAKGQRCSMVTYDLLK